MCGVMRRSWRIKQKPKAEGDSCTLQIWRTWHATQRFVRYFPTRHSLSSDYNYLRSERDTTAVGLRYDRPAIYNNKLTDTRFPPLRRTTRPIYPAFWIDGMPVLWLCCFAGRRVLQRPSVEVKWSDRCCWRVETSPLIRRPPRCLP